MRKVTRYPVEDQNALWHIYKTVSPWKGVRNFIWIQLSRYCPILSVKNWIYRRMLGMKVGKHTAFGLMVMVDVFFPEKITVGENSVIGYNTTILAHEYLIKEYRLGEVIIGENVLIGANTTILPGVTIGMEPLWLLEQSYIRMLHQELLLEVIHFVIYPARQLLRKKLSLTRMILLRVVCIESIK